MAVNLSALAGAGQQFLDNSGNVLTGGKLYTYAAGTTTPQTAYTSSSGATPLSNPIILDAAGRVPTGEIWLTLGSSYKFVLKSSTDVTITTWDNITGTSSNAATIVYQPAGTGAVATTVQAKLRESVSINDFGADPTGVTDSTTALQAALDNAGAKTIYGQMNGVYVPNGTFYYSGTIYVRSYTLFYGPGTLIYTGDGKAIHLLDSGSPTGTQARDIVLRDFTLKTTNAAAQVGIYAQNVIRINFEGVIILGDIDTAYGSARWTTAGIQIDTATPLNSFLLNFINCRISRTLANGIYFSGNNGNTIVNIEKCAISGNDGRAIYQPSSAVLNPCAAMRIVGNEIEGNTLTNIEIGFSLGLEISGNHFEHSTGVNVPFIKLGYDVYALAVDIHTNGFGGSSSTLTPFHIDVNNFTESSISSNRFAEVVSAINIGSATASKCQFTMNSLASPTTLFSTGSEIRALQSIIQTSTLRYSGSKWASGNISNINGSITGSCIAKPGSGTQFQSNAGGTEVIATVGDLYFNSAPASGGYIGWTCVYAGRMHYATTGTLTSGSNVITSVGGAIWDWTVGDLICTDTNALGVPAGTTVTNIGATTITLSVNATANGVGIALYGSRFKAFGLIEV